MAFVAGVLVFVVLIGWVDAGLPWPNSRKTRQ
jgi:hypothetical protein